ncbi:DUF6602 domain-containing protein [Flavobacterium sp.]|uniref:DUF6602 domain-containing protein n=1 Tax=Flavobacterium sp. TaxID=239 RepID=UPI0039E3A946
MNDYDLTQVKIVEFGERVYHNGLRHKSGNGTLYEDLLISLLRKDIPELNFYRGQINDDKKSSSQYDIIICKSNTPQIDFLIGINSNVNVVKTSDCLGVIELKKYATPSMIAENGPIDFACKKFKTEYPDLKYFFICLRFKERKKKIEHNWDALKNLFSSDQKFCFWGNVYDEDDEWNFPWINNPKLINRNRKYLGEYERLIKEIRNLA